MSDDTPAERAEAAETRRRWITLAEVVAVAGVVIAALTLWSNWSDRRADEAAKTEAAASAAGVRSRIKLEASVVDDGRALRLSDPHHDIQEATIAFPRALGAPLQHPIATPTIDAGGFAAAILKATDGGADEREGRLPVLVTVRYIDGDARRSATSIYDVIWRTEGRMLRGRALRLEGIRLRERGGTQSRIDALWKREAIG